MNDLFPSLPSRAEKRSVLGGLRPFRRMAVLRYSVSFSRKPIHIHITRPIEGINSGFNKAMKRRIRPIAHPHDMSMFHRVEMHIIDMVCVIIGVANCMLPITTLPQSSFTFRQSNGRLSLDFRYRFGEHDLNGLPSRWVIDITRRQGPNTMHVIG